MCEGKSGSVKISKQSEFPPCASKINTRSVINLSFVLELRNTVFM